MALKIKMKNKRPNRTTIKQTEIVKESNQRNITDRHVRRQGNQGNQQKSV